MSSSFYFFFLSECVKYSANLRLHTHKKHANLCSTVIRMMTWYFNKDNKTLNIRCRYCLHNLIWTVSSALLETFGFKSNRTIDFIFENRNTKRFLQINNLCMIRIKSNVTDCFFSLNFNSWQSNEWRSFWINWKIAWSWFHHFYEWNIWEFKSVKSSLQLFASLWSDQMLHHKKTKSETLVERYFDTMCTFRQRNS